MIASLSPIAPCDRLHGESAAPVAARLCAGYNQVAANQMEFRILGPLEVENGARAVPLGGARQRALLTILLLRRNEVVPADRLLEELYGARQPATAAKSLHAHVSRLRKALAADRLHTQGSGYLLEARPEEVDADRFARLLANGREALAAGDAREAERALAEALGLWRGPPLGELAYEDFAQNEVVRLEESRLSCLEELFDARLALSRHSELVGELERLVAEHPLRERLRGQLMLTLYRCGRQADALAAYRDARRVLLDELGLEPSRALQDLERAILAQDHRLDPVARPREGPARESEPGRSGTGIFVGRDSELSELESALAAARGGRGGLVLVSGEAGIGKSRLADEMATRAAGDGTRVLWGRCWEAGGAPAYWPWVQALRGYVRECDAAELRGQLGRGAPDVAQLLPELRDLFSDLPEAPSLEVEGARFRLFDSTVEFIRSAAAARPLLIVLDDVHAADPSSLLLLEFVAAGLADTRAVVVAAYRDPELAPDDPNTAALAGVARRAIVRISLRGLDGREVASYIELSSQVEPSKRLVEAIAAETEGNPLFVSEVVRLLDTDPTLGRRSGLDVRLTIPDTVKDVIRRRLDGLSRPCRDALAVASVLGREFHLDVVSRLAGTAREETLALFDEAVAARVVTDAPGSLGLLRFAHILVGDTLYDGLTQARKRELHHRAGEAIEELAGADVDEHLSELAHHFFRALPAVEPEKAVEYARRAGDRAEMLLAHEEAARLYETALQANGLRADPDRAVERALLLALGDALARAGEMPRAKDAFLRGAALARASSSADDLAAAALGYGGRTVWSRASGDRLIVALLQEALTALGDSDTPLRARVLARLAGALRDEHDSAPRVAIGTLAVETARRTGDREALSYALRGLCAAQHAINDHAARLEVAAELREIARDAGDKEAECEALGAEMLVHSELNAFEAVRERATRLAALADELGQPAQRWFAVATSAMLALHEARFVDAEPLVFEARELGARAEAVLASPAYAVQLYLLRREERRADEAHEPLARVAAEMLARPVFRCALSSLAVEAGRLSEARRTFEELAPNGFAAVPRDNEWPMAAAFLVETCRALEDVPRAAVLYDELISLRDRSTANIIEGDAGAMARYLGVLAAMLGHEDDAIAHYRAAVATDEATGAPGWAAYAKAELADLLERLGNTAEAAALRDAAADTAAELGMSRLQARLGLRAP
jgi:DNA-binding SARP family transcriptional activator